jgi:hypothetical protein
MLENNHLKKKISETSHEENNNETEPAAFMQGVVTQSAERDCYSEEVRSKFKLFGPTFGWRPNPEPSSSVGSGGGDTSDADGWGGSYGKVCGHNEVVMFVLRPFYPMEVINTRLCSSKSPAPGNQGYHGCLEFLRLQCFRRGKALTIWDVDSFHFISSDGEHEEIPKKDLLSWSLTKLKLYMRPLRLFTIDHEGQLPLSGMLRIIDSWVRAGASESRLGIKRTNSKSKSKSSSSSSILLPKLCTALVVAFLLGGELKQWKQIVNER